MKVIDMGPAVYYFTGTGNSLFVAKRISKGLNADLRPMVPTLKKERIKEEAPVIGFVFPIYDFKAPDLVNDLIRKIGGLESKYIFAVCTYGVMPLNTMKKLQSTINKIGGDLSGGFGIKMPHNGLGYDRIPLDKKKDMFRESKTRVAEIVDYVNEGRKGTIEKGGISDRLLLSGLLIKMMPKLAPMLKQAVFHGWDSLGFHWDENCISCGTCEMVCPMYNITMTDEKPVWGDDCISCFACFHWCPEGSIQIANLTGKMERYHHPDQGISDMIDQKK